MARRIDPRYFNSLIDANVLDRTGTPEDTAVDEILELNENGEINLFLPFSVKAEIHHPNTPIAVKERANELLYTIEVSLTDPEKQTHLAVRNILRGNVQSGKHDKDAFHLIESEKYGGGYFVTNDKRILKKANEVSAILSSLVIVTPTQFLEIFQEFANIP